MPCVPCLLEVLVLQVVHALPCTVGGGVQLQQPVHVETCGCDAGTWLLITAQGVVHSVPAVLGLRKQYVGVWRRS